MDFVALKSEVRTARKEYRCDAYRCFVEAGMQDIDCENDEQRRIVAAMREAGGKIRPGDKYRYIRGPFEGRMSTWRAREDMDGVCCDLNLYDDY